MSTELAQKNRLLQLLVDALDIPPSYYAKARQRYDALSEWLHRPESKVAVHDPAVYPQGSFRLGTVIRPLLAGEEYDLDIVTQLLLTKDRISQAELKALVGGEFKSYAAAHAMNAPVREKKRCWRLEYADDVSFHMDILPAIPEDPASRLVLVQLGVVPEHARLAVAITDRRHPRFHEIHPGWPPSNPAGFALWFEARMRVAAQPRITELLGARAYASAEQIPTFEWKTPLQRSIQILKRHRDVMFKDAHDVRPISMIITSLSARGYQGEMDLYTALSNILDRMPMYVRPVAPRVANPVNPAEDFADKWAHDARLERNFWLWHERATADVANLFSAESATVLAERLNARFSASPGASGLAALYPPQIPAASRVPAAAPVIIRSGPRPWGSRA